MTHDSCRTETPEYSKSGIDVLSSTNSRTAAELMTRSVHQRYARNSGILAQCTWERTPYNSGKAGVKPRSPGRTAVSA